MVEFTKFIVLWFVLLVGGLERGFCVTAYSNVSCIESERKALLEFKDGLVDKSNRLSSWTGEDCCSWEGVGCSKNTRHVVKIDLRNNAFFDPYQCLIDNTPTCLAVYTETCLGGQISPSLTNLQHLYYLDLSMNNFAGMLIPNIFGTLKNLRYLNLSGAGFNGSIPQHLGNLSALRYLHLGDPPNQVHIVGRLSARSLWWITRLSQLKSLDLFGVYLGETRDWLQAINILPSLSSLTLENCSISSFPHLSHLNFTSLTFLNLRGNHFNSTIPFWLLNVTTLFHLNLAYNNFFGPIPNNLEPWNSLTYLDISRNMLNALPLDSLCNLNNIVYIDVSGNQIQGSLPLCLGNLTSLSALNLGWNNFQGIIPSEIGKLRGLTELSFSANKLNDTIPSSLWTLNKLRYLDLSYTSLKGELREFHFVEFTELKYFDISSTLLVLNVNSLWVPPFQLQVIFMSNVQIGSKFPLWLRTQNEVEYLNMSNTGISDTIPDWIKNVYSKRRSIIGMDFSQNYLRGTAPEFKENSVLSYWTLYLNSNKFEGPLKSFPIDTLELHLENNSLTGSIPQLDANVTLKFLKFLYLSDNHFTGSIPDSLCNIPNLYVLDLSNNQLFGSIPFCFGKFRDLRVLNLANNNLSGHIPTSLGHVEFLQSLHLNGNNFTGELPSSLQKLKFLGFLDLSENRLDGIIPSWIGEELSSLRYLILGSNNFRGNISMCLCQLSFLQVLNLAQNNITGYVPHCFNNFSAMISTDLSSTSSSHVIYVNPISAAIFPYVEKLSVYMKGRRLNYTSNTRYIRSMDLSENHLIGEIPIEIMDLLGLQNLNLSRNHLSGTIPVNIGNLRRGLLSLDFSKNELSGSIPQSLSTLNFLSSLNLSFNKLSGQIPSGNQLQTLDDPSIYMGNNGLCGFPLPNCRDYGNKATGDFGDHDGYKEYSESYWFYAGLGPGIVVGLVGFFSILLFNKSWSYACFGFLENLYGKMSVIIELLKRKFE